MPSSRLLKKRLLSRVVVTLKSGQSFDGLLYAADPAVWVLRDSLALGMGEKGSPLPVDGEVVLFVSEIDYAQRP